MLLSKKGYASWREIQDDFADFKTSLSPWSRQEVVEFLRDKYSNLQPTTEEQVAALIDGKDEGASVSFRRKR